MKIKALFPSKSSKLYTLNNIQACKLY
jgi:hypothetical protein